MLSFVSSKYDKSIRIQVVLLQVYKQPININLPYPITQLAPLEEIIFFDIETTGLQADISSLYLIGCLIYEDNSWQMIQWFADDYRSEEPILHEFFKTLASKKTLIHFNGNGFDLPYLKKKCEHYHLPYTFDHCQSIDLYKQITPYKKILQLPNYKQKTIEAFLNIKRNDPFTGGQLIPVYVEYMKARFGYRETSHYLEPLLLHNAEDLTGMIQLLRLLHYIDLFECRLPITQTKVEQNYVEFQLTVDTSFPTPILFQQDYVYLEVKESSVVIRIAFYYGELKFFYENYKDYYYLKEEDMAVHKSVAEYVDKQFREKAKASTCYTKKTALFLPIPHKSELPCYRYDYFSKQQFIEITKEWLSNKNSLLLYLKDVFLTIGK